MLASVSKYSISRLRRGAEVLYPFMERTGWQCLLPTVFGRYAGSRSKEQLYVPFETDFDREHASIMFWVTKNTNLKEVNVNIRVFLLLDDVFML